MVVVETVWRSWCYRGVPGVVLAPVVIAAHVASVRIIIFVRVLMLVLRWDVNARVVVLVLRI